MSTEETRDVVAGYVDALRRVTRNRRQQSLDIETFRQCHSRASHLLDNGFA